MILNTLNDKNANIIFNRTRDIDIEALPGLNVGQSGMMKDSQVGESNLLSSTTATNVNASTIFSMADGSMMTSIAVGEGSMSLMDSTMGGEEGSSKASQAGDKKDGDAASTTNTLTSTSASTLAQLNQESLNSSLLIMERAVVGNNYHDRLLAYKDVMDYKKRKELEDQAEAARKLEEQNRKAKEEDDDSDDDDREDEGDNEKQSGPGYEEIKVGEVKENVGQGEFFCFLLSLHKLHCLTFNTDIKQLQKPISRHSKATSPLFKCYGPTDANSLVDAPLRTWPGTESILMFSLSLTVKAVFDPPTAKV